MNYFLTCFARLAAIARPLLRFRAVGVMLVASLLLSGCVRYDVGINIADQTHGEIVQHIQIGDQLLNFSDAVAQDWLKSIDRRTRQIGGRTKRLSKRDLVAIIPFNNGADLEAKFNEFFNPTLPQPDSSTAPDGLALPKLDSHLHIAQNNLVLVERNHLTFDLDLRSIGVLASNGNLLISPDALLNLEFNLSTPWGARSVDAVDLLTPNVRSDGNQLVWTLKSGEVNHLEAIFWVPSPLGIGTVAIALIIGAGIFLKSLLAPPSPPDSAQPVL